MIKLFSSQNIERSLLVYSILSCILFIVGTLWAWSTPCRGYELTLYEITPVAYWIGLISSYISGVLLVFFSHNLTEKSKYFKNIGFIILIISMVSLISLYIIRGYFILNVGGDTGSHIGIINSMVVGNSEFSYDYPFVHIEPCILIYLTDSTTIDVLSILPVFTICLLTLGIYLIARQIFPTDLEKSLVAIIALLVPFGSARLLELNYISYVSGNFAYALIPLIIYVTLKVKDEGKITMLVALTLLSISLCFYHPLVGILGIFVIISAISANIFTGHILRMKKHPHTLFLFMTILSTGVVFITWNFQRFSMQIITGIFSLFSATDEIGAAVAKDMITTGLTYGYSAMTLFEMCSVIIILFVLSIFALIVFLCKYAKSSDYQSLWVLIIYSCLLCLISIIAIVGLFHAGYERFLRPIYLIFIVSAGFLLSQIVSENDCNRYGHARNLFVIGIIILICILSIFSYYPSQHTLNTGYQTTEEQYVGVKSVIPYLNYNLESTGIWMHGIWRYATAIYDVGHMNTFLGDRTILLNGVTILTNEERAPPHYTYDHNQYFGDYYSKDVYLQQIEKDRKIEQIYYPEMMDGRWRPIDHVHLEFDKSVNKLYFNSGYALFLVHGDEI